MDHDSSREPLTPSQKEDNEQPPPAYNDDRHRVQIGGSSPIHLADVEFNNKGEEYDDSIRSNSSDASDEESEVDPANCIQEDWHEDRETRETWSGNLDFILSCVGYAVGLGNVWRFPYLCYNNGGGAFLVPYFTFLILCGMPLTMLELCLGQFCSLGPTALFQKFCPLFQGIGWAQVMISGICCVYYNVIIAWTLYYLYLSVARVLPWSTCGQEWNTDNCVRGIGQNRSVTEFINGTNVTTFMGHSNNTATASEEFWSRKVLQISSGIEDMGSIRPELAISLAAAWIMIYACLFKGVKSSGRVVYVTATFPYIVLVILCIRGITLDGAWDGIAYYLWPEWHRLLELKVWIAAASQIFYSVGAAWGVMITFSSFNKFSHQCYRDAMILPIINCFSSVFAGIVVFSIIGFMAKISGQHVKDVIKSGPGLAFVVYPEAVTRLPISPIWSILFFMMLLTIGVDSQFGMFETLITALVDTWPGTLRQRKPLFTLLVCVIMFFLGLPCVMNGGMYVLQLMDWYSATFALMIVGTLEVVLVGWNYGYRRFMADICLMTRLRPNEVSMWWPLCWCFITPIVVLCLLMASIIWHVPATYEKYSYPPWALSFGWSMAMLAIVPIPAFMIYNMIFNAKGSFVERLCENMRPTPDWGPSRLGDRVKFRKSMNTTPGRQRYVLGVDRQETEMVQMAKSHASCVDLNDFVEEAHSKGEVIDSPICVHAPPRSHNTTRQSSREPDQARRHSKHTERQMSAEKSKHQDKRLKGIGAHRNGDLGDDRSPLKKV